jgi:predicted SprT family Zn-dependent metalloprotease
MVDSQVAEFNKRVLELFKVSLKELSQIGIEPAGEIKSITVNKRPRKRLGACKIAGKGRRPEYEIEISFICRDLDDDQLKQVIIHEILHTCYDSMNHGATWKSNAEKVKSQLGYHISTTADLKGLGINEEQRKYRYVVQCLSCGQTMGRMRKSRVVKHPQYYRCSKCGGRLTVTEVK